MYHRKNSPPFSAFSSLPAAAKKYTNIKSTINQNILFRHRYTCTTNAKNQYHILVNIN